MAQKNIPGNARNRLHELQYMILCDLVSFCVLSVLLVRKDQQHGISHLVFVEHFRQLFASILNAITVIAVHNVDETVGALIVVSPQRADLVLASDVPHLKRVIVLCAANNS